MMHVDQVHLQNEDMLRQCADAMPHLAWLSGSNGGVTYINRALRDYFFIANLAEPAEEQLDIAIHPDDLAAAQQARIQAQQQRERYVAEYRLRRHDGVYRWHLIATEPVLDDLGNIVKWYSSAIDVHDLRSTQVHLNQREQEFRATLDHITDAVVQLDRRGCFLYINHEALQFLGKSRESLLGKVIWEEFPALFGASSETVLKEAVNGHRLMSFEEIINGSGKFLQARAAPADNGGLTIYFRDITHNVINASQLKLLETCISRLNEAVVISRINTDPVQGAEVVYVNQAFERLFGYGKDELVEKSGMFFQCPPSEDQTLLRITEAVRQHESINAELIVICKDQHTITIEMDVVPIVDENQHLYCVSLARDISALKSGAIALARSNRALQMYSACTEALIRAQNEKDLLMQICRVITGVGRYSSVWINYALQDQAKTLRCEAFAIGLESPQAHSESISSWDEKFPNMSGPCARCLSEGVAVIVEDLSSLTGNDSWLPAALERGDRGLICLPLRDTNGIFGVLTLFSGTVRPTDQYEVKLLSDLADDISFGINNIRAQNDRRLMQAAVASIATGVTASNDTEFFQKMAESLQKALAACGAFFAHVPAPDHMTSSTIAAIIDGKLVDNFEFDWTGSPCERLLDGQQSIIQSNVPELFPHFPLLSRLKARHYFGCVIESSAGDALGILFVLFNENVTNSALVMSTLQIFASRAAAEMERQEADARIRRQASLLDQARDAIIVCNFNQIIEFWNRGAERIYGWSADEAIGKSMTDLLTKDRQQMRDALECVTKQGEWIGEIARQRKDGALIMAECRWTLVRGDNGEVDSILAIETDITRRRAAENEVEHLAFFDQLTGLPNRIMLMERLHFITNNLHGEGGALLFIDLDNFKDLNDTLGHDIGDMLLIEVAQRLSAVVRKGDIVARLGGDEFVVILDSLSDENSMAAEQAASIADKIMQALTTPFRLGDHDHQGTPSIGITLFDDPKANAGEFVKRADLAMYQAKTAGRNTVRFFDPELHAAVTAKSLLEADFRQGVNKSNFVLHYQPQVDRNGRVIGAEALIRWEHSERGLVPPNVFIPLAEDTGLIHQMGYWVLQTAWHQLGRWATMPDARELVLAVNVSSRQFRHPDFVNQVIALISDRRADPRQLKLELTESLLLDDIEATITKMSLLKDLGVSFSLDDFGTGYSSLAYLKRLPLDQLKIDQSFIKDILHGDSNDAAIACLIVALARSLGLDVIAEGVETPFQKEFLAQNGCSTYQGFLISRPLPIDKFEIFLNNPFK